MQVRSATPAEVGIAPCELKFRAAGKKGKETPDKRSKLQQGEKVAVPVHDVAFSMLARRR